MPTNGQDKNFAEEMAQQLDELKMSSSTLDNAIQWMQDNLEPDDVFTEKQLKEWADRNGYIES